MATRAEKEFADWKALLKRRESEHMLKDAEGVWIEAWSVAMILAISCVQNPSDKARIRSMTE